MYHLIALWQLTTDNPSCGSIVLDSMIKEVQHGRIGRVWPAVCGRRAAGCGCREGRRARRGGGGLGRHAQGHCAAHHALPTLCALPRGTCPALPVAPQGLPAQVTDVPHFLHITPWDPLVCKVSPCACLCCHKKERGVHTWDACMRSTCRKQNIYCSVEQITIHRLWSHVFRETARRWQCL